MWIYILIFIIAVFLYIVTKETNEQSKLVLGLYLLGLALFVGCADMLGGYDRYIYGEVFDQMAIVTQNDGNVLATAGYSLFATEWGYLWFNQLMGYVTLNRYVFIFTVTCVIYTLLFISIKRYCRNYPFAVIVFLGLWFFFTFTYLRQVMAATIGWLAIKYVIDRKPIQFFLIVFIAFTFHNSALVLAPFYFVPAKKFDQVFVFFVLVAALAIGMGNLLTGLVAESDAFIDATRAEQNAAIIEEGTFRIAYFIEAIVFAGLLLSKYDAFDENSRREMVLLNMALVFCAILLVFVRSENGGRIAWHYMIGIISSVTHLATSPKHKSSALTSALMMMFCILFIRIVISWGVLLSPYKTFFTDSHREGDFIYNMYEYDTQYDIDKFYK
jgi:hypothetical protein